MRAELPIAANHFSPEETPVESMENIRFTDARQKNPSSQSNNKATLDVQDEIKRAKEKENT